MKKQLLAIAFGMLSTFSFGQDFVQASGNTGFTYVGDNMTNDGMSTTVWVSTCAGVEGAGGGGTNEAATNSLRFGWGLGEAGKVFNIIELTTAVNLSTAANQKLQVTLRNTVADASTALPLTYYLRLENAANESLLEQNSVTQINVTGTDKTFDIDFSGAIASGKDLTAVKKVIFLFDACTNTPTFPLNAWLFMSNLKVGSPLNVTGVNAALENIAKTNVYPNPSNAAVNVQLDLKSSSDVKVVLNDLYGKEVMVIAEGNYSSLNENFNVSSLAKGMYTITYILNNTPAKTEMLMVR